MISAILFFTSMVVLGVPTAVLFIPWCWLTGNVEPLYRGTRFMMTASCRMAGIRFMGRGVENVPRDRACVFMSNHISNLDPPALIALIPGRTSAFLKRSLMELPVLGTGFKQGDFIAVERRGSAREAQEAVAAAGRVLAKGVHMMTFVEGTRSPDGRMLPFKKGPFFLAMQTGAPVVPVSVFGTEKLMGKGSLKMEPGLAHVVFHKPLDPGSFANREELMAAVRAAIASGLPEWMRRDGVASRQ